MLDLSIITVTHQSVDQIEDLISSVISGALKITTEHLIVDNDSTDGTVERIESHYLPFVTLWKNKWNSGFSAANNQAFAVARGRYVLFLNPDMKVEAGSLDRMVEWMDTRPDAAIATCKLVDPLGQLLIHRCPCLLPQFGRNVLWLVSPLFCINRSHWDPLCHEVKEVEAVLGAFMLTRRAFLEKLGFAFDPRYFLTFDDFDLCREAKRLGYKVLYYPFASCIDYNSRSFFQKSFMWIFGHVAKSMYTYFRKWEPWYTWICIALLTPVGYLIRSVLPKRKSF
jgi:GT2 family glycosyltransferase